MVFRGQIFNTLIEWISSEDLAHETCLNEKKYTSKKYAKDPILTIDDKFILVELKGFEKELKDIGFNFITLDKSILKIEDI